MSKIVKTGQQGAGFGTTFNKAIAAFVASAVPAYGAFESGCSGAFSVFGTSSTTAQILAAGVVGAIAGVLTWWIPNKAS